MQKLLSILTLLIAANLFADSNNLLSEIIIDSHTITFIAHETFHEKYLRENLYVTYEADIDLKKLESTILTMPFIMNTIGIVWISNKTYTIEAMDRELYYSLKIVKEVFKRFYPYTSFEGELIPLRLVDTAQSLDHLSQTQDIALPFSHGLDSLCTSLRHRTTPQLLITARGMPDTPIEFWDDNWRYTQQAISNFAKMHGHTVSYIASNFHEFFNWKELCTFSPEIEHWRLCMVEGLGWMGLAAPILATKGYRTFMLPANGDWHSPHPGADCPLINDVVTYAGIRNISDAFEVTRAEKNGVIVRICNENNLPKPSFIICEKLLPQRKNCCTCYKCITSILALILIDENPADFGFDMPLPTFFDYFKNEFMPRAKLEPDTTRWFTTYQEQAQQKITDFSSLEQDFFNWFCTCNFNALTTEWNNIIIDYNTFLDIYPHIPEELIKK